MSESGEDQTTEFAELTMSGVFKKGILTSDDLLMQSPLMRATGEGTFNLVDETMDYVTLGNADSLLLRKSNFSAALWVKVPSGPR